MSSDASLPPAPPGWYPDPRRQFELRWWDGTDWTEHTHNYETPVAGGKSPRSEWMSRTLSAVTGRAGHIFTLALLFSAVPAAILAAVGWWAAENVVILYTPAVPEASVTGGDSGRFAVAGLVLVGTFITSALFGASVRRQTVAASLERPEPWSVSLAAMANRIVRILGTWIAWLAVLLASLFVAILIISLFAAAAPILLLIALPAVVVGFGIVLIRISLVPAAAALAPRSVGVWREGMAASAGQTRELLVRGFMVWVISVSAQLILSSIIQSAFGGQAATTGAADEVIEVTRANLFGSNVALAVASGLLVAIIGGFAGALRSTGFGLAYVELGGAVDQSLQSDEGDSAACTTT